MSLRFHGPRARAAALLAYLVLLPAAAYSVDMDNDGIDASVDPNDRVPRYHVSVAGMHACALDDAGVHCWGSNNNGESDVPELTQPIQVEAGYNFACAIDANGVVCWGDNTDGQLDVPEGLVNPIQISAGLTHACALHDAGISCWGNNASGQTLVPELADPVYVSAGGSHSCALDSNGMTCWGDNSRGQAPASVAYMSGAQQIVTGRNHTCGLHSTGVNCWGSNTDGQTNIPASMRPVATSNPYRLSAGDYQTCALHDSGAQCWGKTILTETLTSPPSLTDARDIASGAYQSCAIDGSEIKCWGAGQMAVQGGHVLNALPVPEMVSGSGLLSSPVCGIFDNSVVCWGRSNENQLNVPTISNPQDVQVGNRFSCALHDGGVSCWGTSSYSTLVTPSLTAPTNLNVRDGYVCVLDNGVPTCWGTATSGRTTPPAVSGMTGMKTANNHACAWDNTSVECWGANGSGQAGSHALSNVSDVALGGSHSCALGESGVTCWGSNTYGQRNVPALNNPTLIATGTNHSCAVHDGGIQCWGRNNLGQRNVPALTNPRELVAANDYTCALHDSGATCWGNLADGLDRAPADASLQQLITFNGTACAIGDDGLVCWGALAQKQAFAGIAPQFNDLDGDLVPNDLDPSPEDPTSSGLLVSDAGGPYIGLQHAELALDGSASYTDNDGITLSHYRWDQDDSDGVSFTTPDAESVTPSVIYSSAGEFTLTLQVTDSVGRTATSTTTVEILADSDADGVADSDDAFPNQASASIDADGDGFPDDCSSAQACLDDGLTEDPSLDDFDNDGIKSAEDEDDTADTSAPTIIAPPDIDVIASDVETEINLLMNGTPYASDFPNVVLDALPDTDSNATDLLLPSGRHQINWCASDAAGNGACAPQIIDITPLVMFERSEQIVAEGVDVEVLVVLSGNPVSYPVVIPVQLDEDASTASIEDHNAASTTVTINAPDPEDDLADNTGRFVFASVDDGVTGELPETVTFSLVANNGIDTLSGAALAAEALITHTVTITEANVPPVVTLHGDAEIALADETKTYSIDISDPNGHETFFVSWYLGDTLIASGNNLTEIVHDLADLSAGTYTLRVTVLDDGSPAEQGSAEQLVTFTAAKSGGAGSAGTGFIVALLLLLARPTTRRRRDYCAPPVH